MFHSLEFTIAYAIILLCLALAVAYLFAIKGLTLEMRKAAKHKPGYKIMAGAGISFIVIGIIMFFSPPVIYNMMSHPDKDIADMIGGGLLSIGCLSLGIMLYFGAWRQFGSRDIQSAVNNPPPTINK